MSRWRIIVVAALIGTPVAVWVVLGSYYLWLNGLAFIAWWPLMGMVMLGYGLAAYWQSKKQLLKPPEFEVSPHWTARDNDAFKLVEARAKAGEKIPAEKLTDPAFYQQSALEMAHELAAFYHPGSKDPIESLTIPEILAVVEHASHDLCELVEKHLPGGHLLTVRDWKRGKQLVEYYNTGMNAYWAISAVFNPLETATRYLASKVGLGEPMKILQQNLYLWFYTAFIHRLGSYLIDLNSGRLRVGADRYRQLREQMMREAARQESPAEKMAAGPFPTSNGATGHASDRVKQIQVTILGQAKAGKSSLINALLGEQRAKTGVVPTTDGISRYELQTPGIPTRLILLDTVGYASSGPKIDQIKATAEAAKDSDLIFVVLHSRNPGRQADLEMLDGLRKWFESRPEIKAPPIIAVLTHADLLSPSLEWSPPYDWINGTRAKESSMRGAAAATREQLGDRVVSLVPVCTAAGKEWNIETGLIPAVANWLDEIRGVAFLRAIKAEADEGKIVRVFEQAMATGKVVAEQAKTALSKLLTGS